MVSKISSAERVMQVMMISFFMMGFGAFFAIVNR